MAFQTVTADISGVTTSSWVYLTSEDNTCAHTHTQYFTSEHTLTAVIAYTNLRHVTIAVPMK